MGAENCAAAAQRELNTGTRTCHRAQLDGLDVKMVELLLSQARRAQQACNCCGSQPQLLAHFSPDLQPVASINAAAKAICKWAYAENSCGFSFLQLYQPERRAAMQIRTCQSRTGGWLSLI